LILSERWIAAGIRLGVFTYGLLGEYPINLDIVGEDAEFKKRAEAIEKSRKEVAALQERIRGLRRRYVRAEPKPEAAKEQPRKRQGAA